MLRLKKGASAISLILCAVVVTLVTTALVVTTNNSAMYKAEQIANKQNNVVIETDAYTKVYSMYQIESIARQAFANNYLAFYDKEVDFEGFEALVIGEMMQTIPLDQLEDYNIHITVDSISIEKI